MTIALMILIANRDNKRKHFAFVYIFTFSFSSNRITFTDVTLSYVQHIEEFTAGAVAEIVEEISRVLEMDTFEDIINMAKESRQEIESFSSAQESEETSLILEKINADQIQATEKFQESLTSLQQTILECPQKLTTLPPEAFKLVNEVVEHLQKDLQAISAKSSASCIATVPIRKYTKFNRSQKFTKTFFVSFYLHIGTL